MFSHKIPTRENAKTSLINVPLDENGKPDWSSNPTFPMELFRYRGGNSDNILKEIDNLCGLEKKIYTSEFSSFCDERELRPRVVPASDEKFDEVIKLCLNLDSSWVFPDMHIKEYSRSLNITELIATFNLRSAGRSEHIKKCREWAQSGMEEMRERLRCACFSKTPRSGMMWERYSSYGQGVCFKMKYSENSARAFVGKFTDDIISINAKEDMMQGVYSELDSSPEFLSAQLAYQNHATFGDVRYTDTVPQVTDLDICITMARHENKYLRHCLSILLDKSHTEKMLFIKADDYNAEKEWRYVYKRKDMYAPFPAYSLDTVILGANISANLEADVMKKCRQYSVNVARAKPSEHNFGMDVENV